MENDCVIVQEDCGSVAEDCGNVEEDCGSVERDYKCEGKLWECGGRMWEYRTPLVRSVKEEYECGMMLCSIGTDGVLWRSSDSMDIYIITSSVSSIIL